MGSPRGALKKAALHTFRFAALNAVLWAGLVMPLTVESTQIRVALPVNAGLLRVEAGPGLKLEGLSPQRKLLRKRTSGKWTVEAGVKGIRVNGVPLLYFGLAVRVGSRQQALKLNGRTYWGTLELRRVQNGSFQVINEVDLEDYVRGVVPAEMPFQWPMEALKAQAVAARSFALHQRSVRSGALYDMEGTTDGQVYGGQGQETPRTNDAVKQTAGLVVAFNGEVAATFYHAVSGGMTEAGSEIWSLPDLPYLAGVACSYDQQAPMSSWVRVLGGGQIRSLLIQSGKDVGTVWGLVPGEKTASGRFRFLRIVHSSGMLTLKGEEFRRLLGYDRVPRTRFEVEQVGNTFILQGSGSGHGVGMSQWGARELAQQGRSFREILQFYYPGTEVIPVPQIKPSKKISAANR